MGVNILLPSYCVLLFQLMKFSFTFHEKRRMQAAMEALRINLERPTLEYLIRPHNEHINFHDLTILKTIFLMTKITFTLC